METVSDFISALGEYLAVAFAFVSGLILNWKDADSRTKAAMLFGGIVVLVILIALVQLIAG